MDNNKKYLTEENYQRSNKKVKTIGSVLMIIGLILLGIGITFIILGALGIGNEITTGLESGQDITNPKGILSGFGGFAIGVFTIPSGLFLTSVGAMVRFLIGNRREITAYSVQQTMPIAKEGIEEMAPVIGNAAGEIAKGIKKGLNDEK